MTRDTSPADLQPEAQVKLPRVTIDLKVPLWGLVTAGTVLVWAMVSMYFELASVSKTVLAMQSDLKANNAATLQYQREQDLIKYRLEKLEASVTVTPTRRNP